MWGRCERASCVSSQTPRDTPASIKPAATNEARKRARRSVPSELTPQLSVMSKQSAVVVDDQYLWRLSGSVRWRESTNAMDQNLSCIDGGILAPRGIRIPKTNPAKGQFAGLAWTTGGIVPGWAGLTIGMDNRPNLGSQMVNTAQYS